MRVLGGLVIGLSLLASSCGSCPPLPWEKPAATAQPVEPPGDQPGVIEIVDEDGKTYRIEQGPKGDPGCADGQREAFIDAAGSPAVAGCLAMWSGTADLRGLATGQPCGDDLPGACGAPADACAQGWHICGATGSAGQLRAIPADACAKAGGGRFVAALSHCSSDSGCGYREPYACKAAGWCSEPVCCGRDCGQLGDCRDGVWQGGTHIPQGMAQGCGAMAASRARGVLCCQDSGPSVAPEEPPTLPPTLGDME